MQSFKTTLKELIHTTKTGTEHPYFGVESVVLSPNMLARVTSYPPLGDATIVERAQEAVAFTVLFESAAPPPPPSSALLLQQKQQQKDPSPASRCPWEVQLWHNFDEEHTWSATTLQPQQQPEPSSPSSPTTTRSSSSSSSSIFCPRASTIGGDDNNTIIYRLTATLTGRPKPARPVSFTIRFRAAASSSNSNSSPWMWVHDQSGVDDGTLIYQSQLPSKAEPSDLSNYLNHISSDLRIAAETSQAPDTLLWSIHGDVDAAAGEASGFTTHSLGFPSNFTRWFALVRCLTCWVAPAHGKGKPLANKDAIIYAFKRKDGLHLVLLAVSGVKDILTLFQYSGDQLVFTARNDLEQKGTAQVLAAVGYTYDNAAAAVMYHARNIVSDPSMNELIKEQVDHIEEAHKSDEVRASWMQDWYDGFTYCTWNGLGKDLTEQKICHALQSLHDHGIQITNLIIDDNWQTLDNEGEISTKRGWIEFEANKEGFPKGLKSAIQNIRAKYTDLVHVGVWHALLGYWGGISPTGKIAKEYHTIKVKKRGGFFGQESYFVDASEAARMYNDFYSFLQGCGIDSVKTDVQNMLDEIDTAPERRAFTSTYLNTWITAQLKYFSGHAISCMSQAPANLFHTQLPTNIPRLCVRNSDDFFPHVEASHPWHIFCNAHNSLFTKHLNVLPDWDMFQTDHHWASFHAAARCISGGPIYITDEPGKHDVALIRQMTAQTVRSSSSSSKSQAQTVILRPSVVGRSANIYLGYEEQRLCLISAYTGAAQTGASFLGIFNCRDQPLRELIPFSSSSSTSKFMGIDKGTAYVVRSFATGSVSNVLEGGGSSSSSSSSLVQVTMAARAWDILTATPVWRCTVSQQQQQLLQLSNLGLVDKLSGAAAIIDSSCSTSSVAAGSLDTTTTGSYSGGSSVTGTRDGLEQQQLQLQQQGNENDKKRRVRIRIHTTLKALGLLGLWVSLLPTLLAEDDHDHDRLASSLMVLLERKPVPFDCVSVSKSDARVLQIDLEKAWRAMKLDAGFSNELEVDTFIFIS